MPTFYIGHRPVLKGRSDNVNTFTGKFGVYSNWDLMNPSHVLDGAPDRNVVPGQGDYPGDVQLSGQFTGLLTPVTVPLKNPGEDPKLVNWDYGRFPIYQYFGLPGSKALAGTNFGHAPGQGPAAEYAEWSNYVFAGLENLQALGTATLGHPIRQIGDPNAPNSFGYFNPYLYKGVITEKSDPMNNPGHPLWGPSVVADAVPSDYGEIPPQRATVEHYGSEHVMEWFGVPSAKAL